MMASTDLPTSDAALEDMMRSDIEFLEKQPDPLYIRTLLEATDDVRQNRTTNSVPGELELRNVDSGSRTEWSLHLRAHKARFVMRLRPDITYSAMYEDKSFVVDDSKARELLRIKRSGMGDTDAAKEYRKIHGGKIARSTVKAILDHSFEKYWRQKLAIPFDYTVWRASRAASLSSVAAKRAGQFEAHMTTCARCKMHSLPCDGQKPCAQCQTEGEESGCTYNMPAKKAKFSGVLKKKATPSRGALHDRSKATVSRGRSKAAVSLGRSKATVTWAPLRRWRIARDAGSFSEQFSTPSHEVLPLADMQKDRPFWVGLLNKGPGVIAGALLKASFGQAKVQQSYKIPGGTALSAAFVLNEMAFDMIHQGREIDLVQVWQVGLEAASKIANGEVEASDVLEAQRQCYTAEDGKKRCYHACTKCLLFIDCEALEQCEDGRRVCPECKAAKDSSFRFDLALSVGPTKSLPLRDIQYRSGLVTFLKPRGSITHFIQKVTAKEGQLGGGQTSQRLLHERIDSRVQGDGESYTDEYLGGLRTLSEALFTEEQLSEMNYAKQQPQHPLAPSMDCKDPVIFRDGRIFKHHQDNIVLTVSFLNQMKNLWPTIVIPLMGMAARQTKKEKAVWDSYHAAKAEGEAKDSDHDSASSAENPYCYCRGVDNGDMVACDEPGCSGEWFHLACTGLSHPPGKADEWYCLDCRPLFWRNKQWWDRWHNSMAHVLFLMYTFPRNNKPRFALPTPPLAAQQSFASSMRSGIYSKDNKPIYRRPKATKFDDITGHWRWKPSDNWGWKSSREDTVSERTFPQMEDATLQRRFVKLVDQIEDHYGLQIPRMKPSNLPWPFIETTLPRDEFKPWEWWKLFMLGHYYRLDGICDHDNPDTHKKESPLTVGLVLIIQFCEGSGFDNFIHCQMQPYELSPLKASLGRAAGVAPGAPMWSGLTSPWPELFPAHYDSSKRTMAFQPSIINQMWYNYPTSLHPLMFDELCRLPESGEHFDAPNLDSERLEYPRQTRLSRVLRKKHNEVLEDEEELDEDEESDEGVDEEAGSEDEDEEEQISGLLSSLEAARASVREHLQHHQADELAQHLLIAMESAVHDLEDDIFHGLNERLDEYLAEDQRLTVAEDLQNRLNDRKQEAVEDMVRVNETFDSMSEASKGIQYKYDSLISALEAASREGSLLSFETADINFASFYFVLASIKPRFLRREQWSKKRDNYAALPKSNKGASVMVELIDEAFSRELANPVPILQQDPSATTFKLKSGDRELRSMTLTEFDTIVYQPDSAALAEYKIEEAWYTDGIVANLLLADAPTFQENVYVVDLFDAAGWFALDPEVVFECLTTATELIKREGWPTSIVPEASVGFNSWSKVNDIPVNSFGDVPKGVARIVLVLKTTDHLLAAVLEPNMDTGVGRVRTFNSYQNIGPWGKRIATAFADLIQFHPNLQWRQKEWQHTEEPQTVQPNAFDCGVIASETARLLAQGKEPQPITENVEEQLRNLRQSQLLLLFKATVLHEEDITASPQPPPRPPRRPPPPPPSATCFYCEHPLTDEFVMMCMTPEHNQIRFHARCAGYHLVPEEHSDWKCKECKGHEEVEHVLNLVNLGDTCYMSSSILSLYFLDPIREFVLKEDSIVATPDAQSGRIPKEWLPTSMEVRGATSEQVEQMSAKHMENAKNLVVQLRQLFRRLSDRNTLRIEDSDVRPFYEALKKLDPKEYGRNLKNDSADLFSRLLDTLILVSDTSSKALCQSFAARLPPDSLREGSVFHYSLHTFQGRESEIMRHFGLQWVMEKQCESLDCGRISTSFHYEPHLELDFPDRDKDYSLHDMMSAWSLTQFDSDSRIACPSDDPGHEGASKHYRRITMCADHLFVRFRRSQSLPPLLSAVDIPEYFDISVYSDKMKLPSDIDSPTSLNLDPIYQLVSVNIFYNHYRHYVLYVLHEDTWYQLDDLRPGRAIREHPQAAIDRGGVVYFVIYRRCNQKKTLPYDTEGEHFTEGHLLSKGAAVPSAKIQAPRWEAKAPPGAGSPDANIYTCDKCATAFDTEEALAMHSNEAHPIDDDGPGPVTSDTDDHVPSTASTVNITAADQAAATAKLQEENLQLRNELHELRSGGRVAALEEQIRQLTEKHQRDLQQVREEFKKAEYIMKKQELSRNVDRIHVLEHQRQVLEESLRGVTQELGELNARNGALRADVQALEAEFPNLMAADDDEVL